MTKNYLFKNAKSRIRYLIFTLLALILSIGVYAQEITVSGIITGADDGLPVIGASVLIVGQNKGTISGMDGFYTIKVNVGGVLKFSYVGMITQNITVSKPKIDVKLNTSAVALNEVVAIGYGSVKKKELTGAVVQVKGEDLAASVTSDLGTALQGRVSGVNIISSGVPGATSEILIRGISSVSGSNTPLYVVDGVPQENDPGISPNEIETIDVLKDAASCAIYGTRGASGVILISTKQGKAGQMQVSIDGNYGVQHITSGTPLMNTIQQSYFNMVYQRNLTGTADDRIVTTLAQFPQGFQNDTRAMDIILIDYAPTQNYTANISGGTKNLTYNVVSGYYKTNGVIVNSGFERFNNRVNTKYTSGKWQIGASVGLTSQTTNTTPQSIYTQALKYYPTQNPISLTDNGTQVTFPGAGLNNLQYIEQVIKTKTDNKRTQSLVNFNVKYNLSKYLSVTSSLGVTLTNEYITSTLPFQNLVDINGVVSGNPSQSFVLMTANRRSTMSFDAGLTYKRSFGKNNLTGFVGYSTEEYTYDNFSAERTGLYSTTLRVLDAATLDQIATSGNNYDNTLIGMIGRVQYDYKSKYLLSASIRRDGSSKFAAANRYGIFPSVSAAWNVSDEPFWKPLISVANSLKFRVSYGTTGNQNFDPYSYSSAITSGIDALYNSPETTSYGSTQVNYSNALVKWETSIQSNFGFDLVMLNNKLTFSGDYYNTYKKDMLFPVLLPGSVGGGVNATVVMNVGNMTNQGVELSMGYRTKTGKVNWDFSGTFSTNKNVVTKINGLGGFFFMNDNGLVSGAKAQSQVTVLTEGHEAGAFFLYPTNGIADTPEKLAAYQKLRPVAQMGDLIYVDSNKDGVLSDADRVYSGSGLPKYEIGFNVKAEYKGFDLSMQIYSALGQNIMNGAKANAYTYGRDADLIYAWSAANPVTSVPAYRGPLNSNPNFTGYTDQWLEDGSYLRFKTIALGYSLPAKFIKKLGVNKIRLYVNAQNPITITKYTGFDPEVGGGVASRGLDKGNYPISSLYSAGFNIKF